MCKQNNQKRKLIAFSLLFFIIIMIANISPVYAAVIKCPMCGKLHNTGELTGFSRTLYNWCSTIFGGSSLKEMGMDTILEMNPVNIPIWSKVTATYDVMKTIGILLVVVYFATTIYDAFAADNLTAETFLLSFTKLIAGVLIMNNGIDILGGFLGLGDIIFGAIQEGSNSIMNSDKCNFEKLLHAGLFQRWGEMFYLMIPYTMIMGAMMVMKIFCYLRLIDLTVKILFAPIGMADLGAKGTSGSGWRYLKSVAASAIQGGVMMVILFIAETISAQAGWFTMLLIYFTICKTFMKSQSIAKDIMA